MIEWSLARETAAPKTTFPQPRTDCRFERVVSWLPADGMESVPGAVATGSQLTREIGVDPALTRSLPVLTSSIKLRTLRLSVDSYDRSVIQDGYFARAKHHAHTQTLLHRHCRNLLRTDRRMHSPTSFGRAQVQRPPAAVGWGKHERSKPI